MRDAFCYRLSLFRVFAKINKIVSTSPGLPYVCRIPCAFRHDLTPSQFIVVCLSSDFPGSDVTMTSMVFNMNLTESGCNLHDSS